MYTKILRVEKVLGHNVRKYIAGKDGVKDIGEHVPQGPGDVYFCDALMEDGKRHRIFYPDFVEYSGPINLDLPPEPKIIVP